MIATTLLLATTLLPAPAHQAADAQTTARQLLTTGSSLFDGRDAAGLAATYTSDARVALYMTEESGELKTEIRQGQSEIEKMYRELFQGDTPIQARNEVESARFLGPNLLLIEGRFRPNAEIDFVPFIQVRVRRGNQWLIHDLQLFVVNK